ncbi:MAG: hypothetical protein QF593_05780 [Nitrospinota bacterium]|jgi:hypothetical protein|nr:hypothetical protein [Nitrospinota bacterium]
MSQDVLLVIVSVIALGGVFVLLPVAASVYERLRGIIALRCPETGSSTQVRIDAARAARSALFGRTKIRVQDFRRWPARKDCAQACVEDVSA